MKLRKIWLFWLSAGLLSFAGCRHAQSTDDLAPVEKFDPARYAGTWYEIARLPHSFEQGTDRVSAIYTLRPDGRIEVLNRGFRKDRERSIRGIARLKNQLGTGELEVSFFRPFYGDYRIIYLKDDYSCAMVTSSTREYFWILARTPVLDSAQLLKLVEQAKNWGFDTQKMEFPAPVPWL